MGQPYDISVIVLSALGIISIIGIAFQLLNSKRRRELSKICIPVTVDTVETEVMFPASDPVGFVVVVSKVTTKELGPDHHFVIVDSVTPGMRFGIYSPNGDYSDTGVEVVYPLDEEAVRSRTFNEAALEATA